MRSALCQPPIVRCSKRASAKTIWVCVEECKCAVMMVWVTSNIRCWSSYIYDTNIKTYCTSYDENKMMTIKGRMGRLVGRSLGYICDNKNNNVSNALYYACIVSYVAMFHHRLLFGFPILYVMPRAMTIRLTTLEDAKLIWNLLRILAIWINITVIIIIVMEVK